MSPEWELVFLCVIGFTVVSIALSVSAAFIAVAWYIIRKVFGGK